MKKLKSGLLIISLLGLISQLYADVAYLGIKNNGKMKLDPSQTDLVRENLIHIFDSSNFHQMAGGVLPEKTIKEIEEQLHRVLSGSYIELDLNEASRITVEGTELKAKRMWVSIRESDGFVYDWILQKPDGNLVSLQKASGELIVQFAPHVLHLLRQNSEQKGAGNG